MNPHDVPSQVAEPFAGTEHGVHDDPQVASALFDPHAPLHRWEPAVQRYPQVFPSQVAVPPVGADGQATQDAPQLAVLSLAMHTPPQSWLPAAQVVAGLPPVPVSAPPPVAFAGLPPVPADEPPVASRVPPVSVACGPPVPPEDPPVPLKGDPPPDTPPVLASFDRALPVGGGRSEAPSPSPRDGVLVPRSASTGEGERPVPNIAWSGGG